MKMLSQYYREKFGCKVYKLSLDGGFTCPNRDGTLGRRGCIFCSAGGSGDFAESPLLSVSEQYRLTREKLSSKGSVERCIPYLQAHTNPYAPCAVLKEKFEEALALDGVVGMNVATRADCLEDDTVEYLAEIAERTVLTVELGLQSVHDETAKLINRGHSYADFVEGYEKLRKASTKINICVHLIFGLPGETEKMMLESVEKVAKLRPDQVKLHLLHVLKSSALGQIYLDGGYIPMEREAYISTVVDALELLPPETVVARITGDGMAEDLLAPDWSRRKVAVINDVDKLLYQRNTFQGRLWNC